MKRHRPTPRAISCQWTIRTVRTSIIHRGLTNTGLTSAGRSGTGMTRTDISNTSLTGAGILLPSIAGSASARLAKRRLAFFSGMAPSLAGERSPPPAPGPSGS